VVENYTNSKPVHAESVPVPSGEGPRRQASGFILRASGFVGYVFADSLIHRLRAAVAGKRL